MPSNWKYEKEAVAGWKMRKPITSIDTMTKSHLFFCFFIFSKKAIYVHKDCDKFLVNYFYFAYIVFSLSSFMDNQYQHNLYAKKGNKSKAVFGIEIRNIKFLNS